MHRFRPSQVAMAALLLLIAACGDTTPPSTTAGAVKGLATQRDPLIVVNQGSRVLVGTNRIGVALFRGKDTPVHDAVATVDIAAPDGTVVETRPLQFIGPKYGNIPVYVGSARFKTVGRYTYTVHATLSGGGMLTGSTPVEVTDRTPELPVKFSVPDVAQRTLRDTGGDSAQVDSGVPPDAFHDHTIGQGLAAHQPMVLYFGQPGRCASQTCGPTIGVVQDFAKAYGSRFWIEHIEVHDPAQSEALNIAYLRFGLTSEPWIYLVNAQGVVADRFEGPVTVDELAQAAEGTLAGHVPAVSITVP